MRDERQCLRKRQGGSEVHYKVRPKISPGDLSLIRYEFSSAEDSRAGGDVGCTELHGHVEEVEKISHCPQQGNRSVQALVQLDAGKTAVFTVY